jgi:hypothetical protein
MAAAAEGVSAIVRPRSPGNPDKKRALTVPAGTMGAVIFITSKIHLLIILNTLYGRRIAA